MWTIAYSMLVFVTFAAADEAFYQAVKGVCSDVHPVHNYSAQKVASGRWYHQYVSYGKEGDSCASTRGVERGTTIYLDFMIYDKKVNHYVRFADDLTYHPDQPGVYTDTKGDAGYTTASDLLSYFYWVQCVEGDPTKISILFATREPKMNKEEEEVYKKMSAKLESVKLLPKMHKINQTDCPPKYLVEIEKPV